MTLSRLEVARGLRVSTWEAVWATAWAVLTMGAFQTGYALYLGATPFWLGVMASLPAAVGLLQLPASLYTERRGERRRFVAFAALGGRILWVPMLLLPFVLPPGMRLPAFIILLGISSALLTITVPAWTSWISDLVPADSRGQYFARRNMLASIITMLVPLPAGAFLDQAVKYGRFDPRIGFGVLFGIASIAGVVCFVLLLRQPEPPTPPRDPDAPAENPLKSLSAPLGDANFRRFLVYAALFVSGQTLAGQFFMAWQVDKDTLNLPYLTIQILGAIAALSGLLTTGVWGFLTDRYGAKPMLSISVAGTVLAPFLWLFTFPRPELFWLNIGIIAFMNLVSGSFWAGVGLAQFNLLLGLAPAASRSTYVAMFSAATGIVGGIAPILGGALMSLLEPVQIPLGVLTLNNYKILFLMTVLIRVACVFLVSRVADAEGNERGVRYVFEQIAQSRSVASFLKLKRLSKPAAESDRRQTIGELGELRSPLAVEELARALDDVSPSVRQDAARALGEIGDARAVPFLVAKLADPTAAIGDLAAEALGEIGDRTATVALMNASQGEEAGVRVAALRALARIADPASVPALVASLNPDNPATCEAACVALAALGEKLRGSETAARDIAPRLLPLLDPAAMPRGIRHAAARAAAALADPSVYETLVQRLSEEEDAAVAAQMAAALSHVGAAAKVGAEERLRHLLPVLDRPGIHGLAYKQALEAVAEVGLPEGAFYPYLGLSEMARDEAALRHLEEMRRYVRTSSGGGAPSPSVAALQRVHLAVGGGATTAAVHRLDQRLARALTAYSSGDYAACLSQLSLLDRSLPKTAEGENARQLLDALERRANERREARPEEALLGILLLRELL